MKFKVVGMVSDFAESCSEFRALDFTLRKMRSY